MDDIGFGMWVGIITGLIIGTVLAVGVFGIVVHDPEINSLQNAICYMEFGEGYEPSQIKGDTYRDFHCSPVGRINEIDNTGIIVNRGGW